jgi:hypothetical protein
MWRGISETTLQAIPLDETLDAAMLHVQAEITQLAESSVAGIARTKIACVESALLLVATPPISTLADGINKEPITRLRASKLFAVVACAECLQLTAKAAESDTIDLEWEALQKEMKPNRLEAGIAIDSATKAYADAENKYTDRAKTAWADVMAMAALWRALPRGETRVSLCSAAKKQHAIAAYAAERLRHLLERASAGGSVYEAAAGAAGAG